MNNTLNQINPWYIVGLVQADGSFFCTISKKANPLFGLQFRPKFTLTVDLGSINVLNQIQNYFGCGKIFINNKTNSAEFVVEKQLDLINIIIPFFIEYSLVLDKLHSFNLFVKIVNGLFNNTHRIAELRPELMNMAISMNVSSQRTSEQIDGLYNILGISNGSNIPLIPNTDTSINSELDDAFIAGFIDGDGSFSVTFNGDGSLSLMVSLVGYLTVLPLLHFIQDKLSGIGAILSSGNISRLLIGSMTQICDHIIPFMDRQVLHTEKSGHYQIFSEVRKILSNPTVTLSDRLHVLELAYNMNKDGKRRKLTKDQYINLLMSRHDK